MGEWRTLVRDGEVEDESEGRGEWRNESEGWGSGERE